MAPVGFFYRWIAPILIGLISAGGLSLGIYRINQFGEDSTLIKIVVVSSVGIILSIVMFVTMQVIHRKALRQILDQADRHDQD